MKITERLVGLVQMILLFGFFLCCQQHAPLDGVESSQEEDIKGRKWNRIDTGSETINGVRIVIKFDEVSKSFIGALENLSGKKVLQVQLEIRVFDGANKKTSYGPTKPADLAPSATKQIIIQTSGEDNFVSFSMHPKTG